MQSRKKQIKNKNKRNKGHTFKNKKARGGVTPDGPAGARQGEGEEQVVEDVNQQVVGDVNQQVVGEVKQSGEQSEELPVIESTKNKIPLLVATKKGCTLHLEADTEKLTFWYSFADGSDDTKHVTATNDDEFSEAIILLDTAVKEQLKLSDKATPRLDESGSNESDEVKSMVPLAVDEAGAKAKKEEEEKLAAEKAKEEERLKNEANNSNDAKLMTSVQDGSEIIPPPAAVDGASNLELGVSKVKPGDEESGTLTP